MSAHSSNLSGYYLNSHGIPCHHHPQLLSNDDLVELAQLQSCESGQGFFSMAQETVCDEIRKRQLQGPYMLLMLSEMEVQEK